MALDAQALPGLPAQFCWQTRWAERVKKGTFVRVEKLRF